MVKFLVFFFIFFLLLLFYPLLLLLLGAVENISIKSGSFLHQAILESRETANQEIQ